MSFYSDASLALIPSGYKNGKVYSALPTDGTGDLTFTRASTATRVNASGLIESVASGVPRLDYLNSSCPKILLEPQRVNRAAYSNDLTSAAWIDQTSNTTITTVASGAPDGGAFTRCVTTNTGGQGRLVQLAYDSDTSQTLSFYVKGTGQAKISLFMVNGGVFPSPIIALTNSWQRVSVTGTRASGTGGDFEIEMFGGNTLDIWGCQLENGAYPTSIIPTTSAAVTRVADAAEKTGISSLIGQTEGSMYIEFPEFIPQPSGTFGAYLSLHDGSGANRIGIINNGTQIQVYVIASSTVYSLFNFIPASGVNKIAVAYANNDVAIYLNGTSIHTDNSATIPATSALGLNTYGYIDLHGNSPVSQALLFKTRLTNAQLAELTTL